MKERVHEREKALAALKKETAERLRLEDQLRQAQKMEAVGQLTGGIAHDFNNLLVVILGNAEILAAKIPDPLLRSLAADIEAAADRSAELTSRLLAFARRQTLRPEPLDLGDIVQGLAGMLRRTIGEQIALRTDLAPVPLRTMADRALLEASILNLVVNARDAMPDGGTLTIGTGDVVISTDQYIRLSVCDTGTGMPPEVQARVFEPFFTTKETGRGSGLGLSMVHGFIKQSEGHVAIESAPGCGTTVTLLLPALPAESPDVPRASAEKAVQHARAKETILVVEDEAEVRRFVTAQLSSLGYEVVEAEDGPRALERLRAGGNVALLFTDVVLPGGMTGPQLAEAARRLRPGLRVLFTSGYPEETFARHGGLSVNVRLLRKPYRKADLAKAVSAAIDAGA